MRILWVAVPLLFLGFAWWLVSVTSVRNPDTWATVLGFLVATIALVLSLISETVKRRGSRPDRRRRPPGSEKTQMTSDDDD
ncbi:hypothetical protein JIG36_35970 [Actinoplanes sp. LDG1-06]|uniref:Uncharacterized protein n=1 Tax=Paractinoplanes ovalisporus TaxID=2810368 RepID=A0ABS2AM34_9ACTN|nr:hypothetical protein [Actinoplanes ovalisporus]MBM2620912.1 hypothetical protein [Actinoplanes ovalisporus]